MARIRTTKSAALSLNTKKASEAELEAAFTALRDAFRKQVLRLGAGTETQERYAAPYLNSEGEFKYKTLKDMREERSKLPPDASRRNLMYSVQNLQELLQSPRLSIKGWQNIEKRTLQTLQARGYGNLSKRNLAQFGEYMERMRELWSAKFFPSAEVAEAYDSLLASARGRIPTAQFQQLLDSAQLRSMLDLGGGSSGGVDLFAW